MEDIFNGDTYNQQPKEGSYLYEDKLRKKARDFSRVLKSSGIDAEISMVRDYLIKLLIKKDSISYGNLIIDYKAKKDSFSIRTQELKDKSIEDTLFLLWEKGLKESELIDNESQDKEDSCERNGAKEKGCEKDRYEIYVDGSFVGDNVGFGVVILKNDKVVRELSGTVTDEVFKGSRQVGGEIMAVMEALAWCRNNNIDNVSIYYDFENLKKWATGEYSANIPMTRLYREFVQNCGVNIQWNKVAGHTGVRWNERADELAKKGASMSSLSP